MNILLYTTNQKNEPLINPKFVLYIPVYLIDVDRELKKIPN